MKKEYDILIVGYGMLGNLAALLLADMGMSVVVVEKKQATDILLAKSARIDDEVLLILEQLGLIDAVKDLLYPLEGTQIVDKKERVLLEFNQTRRSQFAPLVGFYQPDIQKIIQRSFVYNLTEEKVPLGKLKVGEIEKILEAEPFVLDAEAYVDAQNQLYIHVTQRTPILRVIDKDNQTYYMDHTGRQMPMSDHSTARVLVATGQIPPYTPDFQEPKKKHFLKKMFDLTEYIRGDEFLNPMIEQIYVNQYEEFTLIPKVGRQKIIFGKYEDVEDKFNRLELFYDEGMSREGWQKYKTINLKYRKQVVCEKR